MYLSSVTLLCTITLKRCTRMEMLDLQLTSSSTMSTIQIQKTWETWVTFQLSFLSSTTPSLLQFIHGLDLSKTSSTLVFGQIVVARTKQSYCHLMIKWGCLPKSKLTVHAVRNMVFAASSTLWTLYSTQTEKSKQQDSDSSTNRLSFRRTSSMHCSKQEKQRKYLLAS